MNKYENYYPSTSCFQDRQTHLKINDSMCPYCYSCYIDLCETISVNFDIPIMKNGILKNNCLEYVCEQVRFKIKDQFKYKKFLHIKNVVALIVDILNKYTSYNKEDKGSSQEEKEGCNKLHIRFIECIMKPLKYIIHTYYVKEEFRDKHDTKEDIKRCSLYKLNILCLEVYFTYINNNVGALFDSEFILYDLVKNK